MEFMLQVSIKELNNYKERSVLYVYNLNTILQNRSQGIQLAVCPVSNLFFLFVFPQMQSGYEYLTHLMQDFYEDKTKM